MKRRFLLHRALPVVLTLATLATASSLLPRVADSQEASGATVMPEYDAEGRLLLPDGWRR